MIFGLNNFTSNMTFVVLAIVLASVSQNVVAQAPGVYAQLSSNMTQPNGPLGTGVAITYESVDALNGIGFVAGSSEVEVLEAGAYFIIAAPQVGYYCEEDEDDGEKGGRKNRRKKYEPCKDYMVADYWVIINGENAANSNIRYAGKRGDEDVIVTQGVYVLSVGDKIQVFGSGENTASTYIQEAGEPDVPSIIFSMYKLS